MIKRQPINKQATSLMFFISMIWGLQQVAIKYVVSDIAPIFQIAIRSGLAAVFLTLFIFIRREFHAFHRNVWHVGLVVGFLFASEYMFVGEGLKYTSASHMVVFLYTAPIFAAIGLNYLLPEERLAPLQWIGIATAFWGIIVAFYISGAENDHNAYLTLIGDIFGLLGGIAWGATTVVIRCTKLSNCPASQTLLYQLIGAFILLLIASIVLDQTHVNWTSMVFLSLGFQSIILCFMSFLIWFWLLRFYLATQLSILSLMTPLFGVAFGVLIMNDPLLPRFIIGSLFVLIGVFIVISYPWLRAKLKYSGRIKKKPKPRRYLK